MRLLIVFLSLLSGILLLSGCPSETSRVGFQKVAFSDLPGWNADNPAAALPALKRSCARLMTLPADRPLGGYDNFGGTVRDWEEACRAVPALNARDAVTVRAFFERYFQPWQVVTDDRSQGLFTGYYEAELRGSFTRTDRFNIPILGKPSNLKGTAPDTPSAWPDRRQIEAKGLSTAPVLLWVDDPIEAHILHIQGSGRVLLPDGRVQRIGFAASNGHPFKGLGRILLDKGKLAPGEANMPAIRAWLRANPQEAAALMAENPRYVFFRLIDGDGPIGAQGVALTPERSLAVDPAYIPLGVPVWLDSRDPLDGAPMRRLMIAQDTGSAIKGAVRGDFFWGSGEDAFQKAGRMKSPGSYYLLLPKRRR